MSQSPFSASALRGAVDLSALKRPPAGASRGVAGGTGSGPTAGGGAGAAGAGAADGVVVEGTDAGFQDVVNTSLRVPVVIVLWTARDQVSVDFVDVLTGIARSQGGRFQLVTVDVDANPGVLRAFQVQSVPATFGIIQGQPVPLFQDAALPQEVLPVLDQLLQLAVQHGVTGRVETSGSQGGGDAGEGPAEPPEPPLPPHLQAAYDAIDAGDLDGAEAAYRQALKDSPADAEAKIGLAQVGLMKRTEGVDHAAARTAAAEAPTDVDAQILVADLDLLGGHVEDAFGRLVDLVRVTADAERNTVRQHLIELFDIIGPGDERVLKARKALMSALF